MDGASSPKSSLAVGWVKDFMRLLPAWMKCLSKVTVSINILY